NRNIDILSSMSGLKLEQGETKTEFKVSEICVYKVKTGFEQKRLTQAQTVVLLKGKVDAYIQDSPVPQWLDSRLLAASGGKTFQGVREMEALRTTLLESQKAKAALSAELDVTKNKLAQVIKSDADRYAALKKEYQEIRAGYLSYRDVDYPRLLAQYQQVAA